MNQPTNEQRITRLEQRLDTIEKQEREYSFAIRDIAHKATITLGIATAQEADIKEVRTDIKGIKADVVAIKATQSDHSEMLKEHGEILKGHGEMLKEHGEILKEHGEMLRAILARLPGPGEGR